MQYKTIISVHSDLPLFNIHMDYPEDGDSRLLQNAVACTPVLHIVPLQKTEWLRMYTLCSHC
jgi:hypothetical protein